MEGIKKLHYISCKKVTNGSQSVQTMVGMICQVFWKWFQKTFTEHTRLLCSTSIPDKHLTKKKATEKNMTWKPQTWLSRTNSLFSGSKNKGNLFEGKEEEKREDIYRTDIHRCDELTTILIIFMHILTSQNVKIQDKHKWSWNPPLWYTNIIKYVI